MIPSLETLRFRASPHVELRRLSELDPEVRKPFLELESDSDFHGLFVPKPPLTLNLKSVQRQTAELFLSLSTPAYLDLMSLGDTAHLSDLVDLVLDGFLEIESDGRFISGADAFPILCLPLTSLSIGDTVGRLSREALLHAQDLQTRAAQELTVALYSYNRVPLTPFWKARFPDGDAVLAYLGADRGPLHRLLQQEWHMTKNTGWLFWSAMSPRANDAVTFKLYVSPRPERIREVFEVVARVLSGFPGTAFKIGDRAAGILRSDKLVAYFRTREELDEAAAALRAQLSGCEAQGVPFTACFDDAGLLSWGIDPPKNNRPLSWLDSQSWRFWIAQRLGAAISVGKLAHSHSATEPWRFAVERVRRDGVDVETWTPSPTIWSRS
jgi:hypothetical protein